MALPGASQASPDAGEGKAQRVADFGGRLRAIVELVQSVRRAAHEDGVDVVAAGLAFYGLFGVFPALMASVSLYGLVADPIDMERTVQALSTVLPNPARLVVTHDLAALVARAPAGLGLSFALGLLVVLWSSSTAVSALVRAINLAYNIAPQRGFLHRRWVSLLFTLAAVLALSVAVPLVTALPVVFERLDWHPTLLALQPLVVTVLAFLSLLVVYRYAPEDARYQSIRKALPGALFAAGSWVVMSALYSAYVAYIGDFASTYGALEGVIVLCLWFYLLSLVVLLGAELNAELAKRGPPSGAEAASYEEARTRRRRRTTGPSS